MSQYKKNIICLMGPTTAGKTNSAIALAQSFPCEIISVDSGMIYRNMNIGTAKPTREELLIAPHRLIDIRDPHETYSAAQFRLDALDEIENIFNRGKIPLLVGGTMLYFKILQEGISPLPQANPTIRTKLNEEAAKYEDGWHRLYLKLQRIDPSTAIRLSPKDKQRIQRALEVYEITGIPMSQLCTNNPPSVLPYNTIKLAIAPMQRSTLREKIEHRLQTMLQHGLIFEVEELFKRGNLHLDLPSMRAVGYRQVWEYLNGKIDIETMQQNIITATYQLAKHQLTWLRSWHDIIWLDSGDANYHRKLQSEITKILY